MGGVPRGGAHTAVGLKKEWELAASKRLRYWIVKQVVTLTSVCPKPDAGDYVETKPVR